MSILLEGISKFVTEYNPDILINSLCTDQYNTRDVQNILKIANGMKKFISSDKFPCVLIYKCVGLKNYNEVDHIVEQWDVSLSDIMTNLTFDKLWILDHLHTSKSALFDNVDVKKLSKVFPKYKEFLDNRTNELSCITIPEIASMISEFLM
jgi:hypothetical protein